MTWMYWSPYESSISWTSCPGLFPLNDFVLSRSWMTVIFFVSGERLFWINLALHHSASISPNFHTRTRQMGSLHGIEINLHFAVTISGENGIPLRACIRVLMRSGLREIMSSPKYLFCRLHVICQWYAKDYLMLIFNLRSFGQSKHSMILSYAFNSHLLRVPENTSTHTRNLNPAQMSMHNENTTTWLKNSLLH